MTMLPLLILAPLLHLQSPVPVPVSNRNDPVAERVLRDAIATMGGEKLRALSSVRWSGMASDELPGIVLWGSQPVGMFREFSELRDLDGSRLRRASTIVLPMRPAPITFTEIVTPSAAGQLSGDRLSPGSPTQVIESQLSLALGPERALFTALASGDARLARDTVIGGAPHRVVRFQAGRVSVYIGRESRLLGAVALAQSFPADQTWGMWDDVVTMTLFSAWSWRDGIRLPHQLVVLRNGNPFRRVVLREITLAAAAPADSFALPDSIASQYRARAAAPLALGSGENAPREIAPGVLFLPGPFNVMAVAQPDGIVVLAPPHSSAYSELVLAELAQRYPGTRVKAVVVSSSTWPHLAGIKEYASRGIPIYAAPAAIGLLRRLTRSARLHPLPPRLQLGSGDRRLELFLNTGPGVSHPDQVAVYLPQDALLFAADLHRPERFEPNLWRQPLAELAALVERQGLRPKSAIGFHIGPTPWSDVLRPLNPSGP